MPYSAAFDLTRALLPGIVERDRGRIAFVTSPAAYVPIPGAPAYTASRWPVRGFAHALRGEVRETGVGVTLVVPGVVASSYFEANENVRERLPPEYRLVVATGRLSTGLARRLAGRGHDGEG